MKEKKEFKKNIFDYKNNKKMIVFYIATILFIVFTVLIRLHVNIPFDKAIESFIIGIRNEKLTKIMINITNLSRAYFLIAITILLFFILKDKRNVLLIGINLTSVFLSSQILKFIFRRARPDGEHLVKVFGYSYPSGHAMVSMAYFGFIAYLINKKIKNKLLKIFLIIVTGIVVFLIGFSRIYLGVHYTSDVIGGYIISCAYLMLFLTIVKSIEVKK